MATSWNSLSYTLHHLTLFVLLHQVLSGDCELIHSGTILNCSNLSEFPNGSLYQDVATLNFHNNNFSELTPYVFKNHNFYGLQMIIIRQNNIIHIHPHAFSGMSSIRELDLYGNNLTYLPDEAFVGLKGLKYLDLGHNKLVLVEGGTFKPLQSLETLDLSYNNIKAMTPYLLEHTNVSELYLSGNEFEFAYDDHILESKSLTVLTLQSCKLKSLHENSLEMLPNLRYLDISYNQLEFLPEGLLKPLVQLEQLDISSNQISNVNINMFPLPSRLEVLLCDENLSECEDIVEKLQMITENYTTTENSKPSKEIMDESDRLSSKYNVSVTTIAYHKTTEPTVRNNIPSAPQQESRSPKQKLIENDRTSTIRILFDFKESTTSKTIELSSDKRKKESELEKYLYIGIYGLSGIVIILFIIFFIEICYLLKLNRREELNATDVV